MTGDRNGNGGDPFLDELREAGIGEAVAGEVLADALEPAKLPMNLRARILASAEVTSPFAAFAAQIAKLVDVGVDAARELLLGIDRSENWADGPLPAIGLYNFDGGPAVANAITGFIQMAPGTVFPLHEHVGRETIVVLAGRFRDSDGRVAGPGETVVSEAGTSHSFEVLDGPDLIYLAVVDDGITIGGEVFGPDDPRM